MRQLEQLGVEPDILLGHIHRGARRGAVVGCVVSQGGLPSGSVRVAG